MGPYSVIQCVRHLMGQPLYFQLPMLACGERQAMVMAPPPTRDSAVYRLASVAAQLSSTGLSHHSLLPHITLIRLSAVNSSPRPGIAPQSLNPSSQPLHLPGDQHSCPGYVWLRKDCLILILFRLPQISCFTLSLKCFSSDSDNCPSVGIRPLLQFPHCGGQVKSCFSPLVPSSYQVLHGSIYSFPVVGGSRLLSAGVRQALLCLNG